jgi:YcxB-like protein
MLLFKYQLTEEEYFEFNYYTFWTAPFRKKYRWMYYLRILLLYAAVAVLYISLNKNHNPFVDIAVFGTIALGYTWMVPFFVKRSVQKRTKQILAQPENKHIIGVCEVQLSETGIVDKDSASETRYLWDAIVRRAETKSCVFLYTNSHHAIVIPKRIIKDAAEKKDLDTILAKHLPLAVEW